MLTISPVAAAALSFFMSKMTVIRTVLHRFLVVLRWASFIVLFAAWISKILLLLHAPAAWAGDSDYVTGLNNRITTELALVFDLFGLASLVFFRSGIARSTVLLMTGSVFLLYHAVAEAIRAPGLCPCLSGLNKLVGLSTHSFLVLSVASAFFLFASGFLMYMTAKFVEPHSLVQGN